MVKATRPLLSTGGLFFGPYNISTTNLTNDKIQIGIFGGSLIESHSYFMTERRRDHGRMDRGRNQK